jgi:hypothetical protein
MSARALFVTPHARNPSAISRIRTPGAQRPGEGPDLARHFSQVQRAGTAAIPFPGGRRLLFPMVRKTMTKQLKDPKSKLMMSRRGMLLGGATLLAGGMVTSICPSIARAAADATAQSRFMQLSNLLIDHDLNPAVGARIAETASGQYRNFAGMLDAIIAIAEKKQATQVEDFFADVPDGELKDFAHWVIFAWYSGCSSEKRDARVFTYEEALTFKTTSDVVTIPSYGISGPNLWTRPNVPLSAPMPRF